MENTNIISFHHLIKPNKLKEQLPITENIRNLVINTRQEICNIIKGKSDKKLFIIGPCSIHNVNEALIYAKELKNLADLVRDKILIVMRVYFEKPRTTIGWKGLINDPFLDNSFQVNKGLELARKLLLDINNIGLPCGYEVLDTITPQYISDLMSWGAIGARTTESQVHRQMVSGLSMPVGFKNGTSGSIVVARDAVMSARYPHCFMGITDKGNPSICTTRGNKDCHVILRGGIDGPNFYFNNISDASNLMLEKKLYPAIMIDCSHGNSLKDHRNQTMVLDTTLLNMKIKKNIIGCMIESNINEGKQTLENDVIKYGVSITDACIGLPETFKMILRAHQKLNKDYSEINIKSI
tara:strand:+ start:259 stop:1317 length:1059 start_codon:yes stop_codon:yes gene_type:complete